jgi:hypothetical protein
MEFAVHGYHRAFMDSRGWLQFEGIFTPEEVSHLADLPPSYDLWRHSSPVRKLVLRRSLADLMAQLLDLPSLRIGYDQLLPAGASTIWQPEKSSIQGLTGGLLIPLNPAPPRVPTEQPEPLPIPLGGGLVLRPETPIIGPLPQTCLFIAYVTDPAVFRYQENDPYGICLRNLSYSLGDRLCEPQHPLLCR